MMIELKELMWHIEANKYLNWLLIIYPTNYILVLVTVSSLKKTVEIE